MIKNNNYWINYWNLALRQMKKILIQVLNLILHVFHSKNLRHKIAKKNKMNNLLINLDN